MDQAVEYNTNAPVYGEASDATYDQGYYVQDQQPVHGVGYSSWEYQHASSSTLYPQSHVGDSSGNYQQPVFQYTYDLDRDNTASIVHCNNDGSNFYTPASQAGFNEQDSATEPRWIYQDPQSCTSGGYSGASLHFDPAAPPEHYLQSNYMVTPQGFTTHASSHEPAYKGAAANHAHHGSQFFVQPTIESTTQVYHSPVSNDGVMQSPLSSEHSHYQLNGYANDGSHSPQQFAFSASTSETYGRHGWAEQKGSGYDPDGQSGLSHDVSVVQQPTNYSPEHYASDNVPSIPRYEKIVIQPAHVPVPSQRSFDDFFIDDTQPYYERSDLYPYSKPPQDHHPSIHSPVSPSVSYGSSSLIAPEPNHPPPKQPLAHKWDSSSVTQDPQADRMCKTEDPSTSCLEASERILDRDTNEVGEEVSMSSPPQIQDDDFSDDDSDSDYEEHPHHSHHRSRGSPKATRQSTRKRTPLRRSPSPRLQPSLSRLSPLKKSSERKLPLACLFCRGRKIACGPPPPDSTDDTCNQCARRNLKCEHPAGSRRGIRRKREESVLGPQLPTRIRGNRKK